MHELPVTQSILEIVEQKALEAGASRITRITLQLGEWSGFVDDCIQFYFDMLSEGTLAQGAELSLQRIPVRFRCRTCGEEFSPPEYDWRCPQCGSLAGEMMTGREFYVDSIEVE
jgi:hydrogenase nickel incorporation protein HypA/HybF